MAENVAQQPMESGRQKQTAQLTSGTETVATLAKASPDQETKPIEAGTALISLKDAKRPQRIGDVLVQQKLVSPEQLRRALSEARANGQPIGATLVKLGYVSDSDLGRALAFIQKMEYVDTSTLSLSPDLLALLPEGAMKKYMAVPIEHDEDNKRLTIAITRPDNIEALDEISLITGCRVVAKLTTHTQLSKLLDRFHSQYDSSDEALEELKEELEENANQYELDITKELEAEMAADDAPVVRLVNALLMEAVEQNASDIHIEPQKERLLVRFRVDGILREVKSIPKQMAPALASRIKVVSGMDIAERRRPQDGRTKIVVGSSQIDMRVNSLAVQFGEKIVMRLLKPNATSGGLSKLGLNDDEVKRFNKMIRSPHGIILVTGPTGSGKTTTLYSCLREINSPDVNITTIEDPVEYPLPGVNQTQISHKAGLNFSVSLRAILRQDPDVIMVGEIRDKETLDAAIHASMTGHLVFSTVHTNSTAKTIARLLEMGAPPYLVSSSVIGIVAQRLVRRVCEHCRTSYQATPEELEILGMTDSSMATLYEGRGCEHCNYTGYSGRVGLYEIMNTSREIEELVDNGASSYTIQDAAVREGMQTLAMDGKRKILRGLTSVKEVTRVLGLDLSD